MKQLILVDTETTGLRDPRLVELAYKIIGTDNIVSLRCNPPKDIEIGASMVNHITNKMVAPFLAFKDMPAYEEIKDVLENSIIIAHNALYDIGVLKAEGINIKEWTCTKEIAEAIYPKAEMYRLQYLRYWLGMEIDAPAHTAGGDLLVLEELWNQLSTGFKEATVVKWKHSI